VARKLTRYLIVTPRNEVRLVNALRTLRANEVAFRLEIALPENRPVGVISLLVHEWPEPMITVDLDPMPVAE
jgi:hypothetical protein